MRDWMMWMWAVVFAGTLGCGRRAEPSGPPSVVCTVAMVADVARTVAGDRALVVSLMGEGVDPHLYKPTRSDVSAIQQAEVVLYVGHHLEGKMGDVLHGARTPERPVVAVGEEVPLDLLIHPEGSGGTADPHLWMDVRVWTEVVRVVERTLAAWDPEGAEGYRGRAEALVGELGRLDEYVRRVIGSIPEDRRVLVTAHDAFEYLGKAYGIEVIGIQGLSTESEAGLDDLNRLVGLLVDRKIPSVFVETSVADRNVRALIEGARSRGHEVMIGGSLFSDAMGSPGTYRGTYIGMIDHNATVIARSLGGEAPVGGFQGRLAETP